MSTEHRTIPDHCYHGHETSDSEDYPCQKRPIYLDPLEWFGMCEEHIPWWANPIPERFETI